MRSRTRVALGVAISLLLVGATWFVMRPASQSTSTPARPRADDRLHDAESVLDRSRDLPTPLEPAVAEIDTAGGASHEARSAATVTVLGEDARPLKGILVAVRSESLSMLLGDGHWPRARTDADGRAAFVLAEGHYGVDANFGNAGDCDTAYGYARSEVAVAADGHGVVEITLGNAAGRLTVTVRDDAGAPLPGVDLRVEAPPGYRGPKEARTDDRGEATWERVTAGPWTADVVSAARSLHVERSSRAFRDVRSGEAARLDIVLNRMSRIMLRRDSIPGLANLHHVEIQPINASAYPPWEAEMSWVVPAGTYVVNSSWNGESGFWSGPALVTVEPGETAEVQIATRAGDWQVAGSMTDSAGRAVERAWVEVSVALDQEWSVDSGSATPEREVRKWSPTDAAGLWECHGLPPGRIVIRGSADGARDRYLADQAGSAFSDRIVRVEDVSGPVALAAQIGCEIRGMVPPEWAALVRDNRAIVEVSQREPAPVGRAGRFFVHLADDGSFTLPHKAAGLYAVVVKQADGAITQPCLFSISPTFVEGETVTVPLSFSQ